VETKSTELLLAGTNKIKTKHVFLLSCSDTHHTGVKDADNADSRCNYVHIDSSYYKRKQNLFEAEGSGE